MKKILTVAIVISMLSSFLAFAEAPMVFKDPSEVLEAKNDKGVYTVTVQNSYFANSDITVAGIAVGSPVTFDSSSPSVAYIGEKKADDKGFLEFKFRAREGFDNKNGIYIAMGSSKEFTFDGKPYLVTATPEVVNDGVIFSEPIVKTEITGKYENIPEEAKNAKYASIIFSKRVGLIDECGMIYSKTNNEPLVTSKDSVVTPAINIGVSGAFAIYYYTNVGAAGDTYYVRPYIKIGNNYKYGKTTTFTLSEVK